MSGPVYPEAWLRAWASLCLAWPGAGSRPRVDAITRAHPERETRLGCYHPDRHAITVFDTGDKRESLATLLHELAHAWAPYERRHHGPRWQETYRGLLGWFFGRELPTLAILRDVGMEAGWHLHVDGRGSRRGNGDRLVEFALDVASAAEINRTNPTLHIPTTLPMRIVATFGPDAQRQFHITMESVWQAARKAPVPPSAG